MAPLRFQYAVPLSPDEILARLRPLVRTRAFIAGASAEEGRRPLYGSLRRDKFSVWFTSPAFPFQFRTAQSSGAVSFHGKVVGESGGTRVFVTTFPRPNWGLVAVASVCLPSILTAGRAISVGEGALLLAWYLVVFGAPVFERRKFERLLRQHLSGEPVPEGRSE